jgi:hypothetical protein
LEYHRGHGARPVVPEWRFASRERPRETPAGGMTLIYDVKSDGSAGTLAGMLMIWWD